jgi:hypothetical protein
VEPSGRGEFHVVIVRFELLRGNKI